jgi:hypothetical protein
LSAGAPRCKGRHTDRWEFSPYRRRWSPACRKPKAESRQRYRVSSGRSPVFPKSPESKKPDLVRRAKCLIFWCRWTESNFRPSHY